MLLYCRYHYYGIRVKSTSPYFGYFDNLVLAYPMISIQYLPQVFTCLFVVCRQKGVFPTSRIQRQCATYQVIELAHTDTHTDTRTPLTLFRTLQAEAPVSSCYLLTGSHRAMNAEHLRDRNPELDPNSLLPDLPTAYHIILPTGVPMDKVSANLNTTHTL
jgi:hypothetical protein